LVLNRTQKPENSNRELESYSYSIAHDLRTPLRSITSFSQIVLDDAKERLDTNEKDYLHRVVNAGKHMAKIIDEILQLSRITRNELERKSIDLTELTMSIIARYRSYETAEQKITWNVQEQLYLFADKDLLNILMDNLINNALKYSSKSPSPMIEVGCTKINKEDVFYVKDNGIGFEQEFAERMFQTFSRLHSSEEYEGLGVGLATVQRIVHRHGGRIWAEGEVEKGATFYFTMPDK
jgi:light-regulated signal transduction histidine kinase (bacteriophytochrome)